MTTLGRGPRSPINITAGAALTSGRIYQVGTLVGLAIGDAASGAQAALATEGVFELPKATGYTITQGDVVYYDCITDFQLESTGVPIGVALESAGTSATTCRVSFIPEIVAAAGGRNNPVGAARPAATDDESKGFAVGSLWYYAGIQWICTDATGEAAHWRPLNPIVTTTTVASGQTSISSSMPTGAANGDYVQATVRTKGANAASIVEAKVAGGNLVVTVSTDPGTGGAVCSVTIWPVPV